MKSFSTIPLAAGALMLSMASVVSAQSMCAIQCFQSVITEHPPTTCTEDNMYLCFCKSQSLTNYFIDCAYAKCGDQAETSIGFGVNICAEYGAPITIPPRVTDTPPAPISSEPAPVASESSKPAPSAAVTSVAAAATSGSVPAVVPPSTIVSSVVSQPTHSGNGTVVPPVAEAKGSANGAAGVAVLAGIAMAAML